MTAQRDLLFVMNFRIDSDRALAQLNKQFQNLSTASQAAQQAVNNVNNIAKASHNTAAKVKKDNESIKVSYISLGDSIKTVLGLFGIYGAGQVFGKLVDIQQQWATLYNKMAFAVTDRSPDEMLKTLQVDAKNLGQRFMDMADGFGSFAAAAQATGTSVNDLHDSFIGVTSAATVLHLSGEDMKNVFFALSQMMSKGKVLSEEFRLQLAERMPIAITAAVQTLQRLKPELHATVATFTNLLQSGSLTAKFAVEMGKQMGIIAKQYLPIAAESFVAVKNDFLNTMDYMLLAISNNFTPALRNAMIKFNSLWETNPAVKKFAEDVGSALGSLSLIASQAFIELVKYFSEFETTANNGMNRFFSAFDSAKFDALAKNYGVSISSIEKAVLLLAASSTVAMSEILLGFDNVIKATKYVYNAFIWVVNLVKDSASIMEKAFQTIAAPIVYLNGLKDGGIKQAHDDLKDFWDLGRGKNDFKHLEYANTEIGLMSKGMRDTVTAATDYNKVLSKIVSTVADAKAPLVRNPWGPQYAKAREDLLKKLAEEQHMTPEAFMKDKDLAAYYRKRVGLWKLPSGAESEAAMAKINEENAKVLAKMNKDLSKNNDIIGQGKNGKGSRGGKSAELRAEESAAKQLAEAYRKLTITKTDYENTTQLERVKSAHDTFKKMNDELDKYGTRAEVAARDEAKMADELANLKAVAESSNNIKSVQEVDALIKKYGDMKAAQNDWAAQTKMKLQDLAVDSKVFADRFSSIMVDAFDGASSALADFVTTGKLSFTSLVNDIAKKFAKLAMDRMIFNPLSTFLGGSGGSSFFSSLTSFFHHSGGIVGENGRSANVSPLLFMGAPRYHSGGIAGLKPNEVPAILQKGEMVIPRNRVGMGSGANIQNNFNVTVTTSGGNRGGDVDPNHAANIGKEVTNQMRALVVETIQQQMRSGGILNQRAY